MIDMDTYFYWDILLENDEKSGSLMIGVIRHTQNASGNIPLDCRLGLDHATRAKGLGYLCLTNLRGGLL